LDDKEASNRGSWYKKEHYGKDIAAVLDSKEFYGGCWKHGKVTSLAEECD